MKTGTFIHIVISCLGGFFSYVFGGYDLLLKTLLSLSIMDFITGTGQSLFNHSFRARICAKGIGKKLFIYFTVALAVIIGYFIGNVIPLRETVITFYIVSEGMSSLENIGKVIPYPDKLKKIFLSLNEDL